MEQSIESTQFIRSIVQAENQATGIAAEAKARLEGLEAELSVDVGKLREEYDESARQRIEKIREAEQAQAEHTLEELDRRHAAELEKVESTYKEKREEWIDKIFGLVVGA